MPAAMSSIVARRTFRIADAAEYPCTNPDRRQKNAPNGKRSVRQLQSLPALDVRNEKVNQYEVHAGKGKAESILISALFSAVCKC